MRVWRALVPLTVVGVALPLGVLGAQVTWAMLGEGGRSARPMAAALHADAGPRADAGPQTDLGPILALAPFGQLPQAAVAAAPAPVADLGLTLRGVILAADPGASQALVAGRDGRAAPYGPGDPLPGGATLQAVFADRAVVVLDGTAHTLAFPVTPTRADGAAAIRAKLPGGAGTGAGAPGVTLPNAGLAPDQVIASYRRLIAENPQAVLDRLGVTATANGYRIGDNAHAGVRRAGLRPGDVIARINGTAVGDVTRDRAFFDEIAATGRARVEVVRDGQSIVLSFPLR